MRWYGVIIAMSVVMGINSGWESTLSHNSSKNSDEPDEYDTYSEMITYPGHCVFFKVVKHKNRYTGVALEYRHEFYTTKNWFQSTLVAEDSFNDEAAERVYNDLKLLYKQQQ